MLLLVVYVKWNIGVGIGCPVTNQIVINEADEGKGEELRAGKPRDEEEIAETRHSVGREEFRGMNGLEKKYNLVIVGAGLSGAVMAERASKLLGLKVSQLFTLHLVTMILLRVWLLTSGTILAVTAMTT